jgi:hypothetical protein
MAPPVVFFIDFALIASAVGKVPCSDFARMGCARDLPPNSVFSVGLSNWAEKNRWPLSSKRSRLFQQ